MSLSWLQAPVRGAAMALPLPGAGRTWPLNAVDGVAALTPKAPPVREVPDGGLEPELVGDAAPLLPVPHKIRTGPSRIEHFAVTSGQQFPEHY